MELEGLEKYYTNDGEYLGQVGDDQSTRIMTNIASADSPEGKDVSNKISLINELKSSSAGVTEEGGRVHNMLNQELLNSSKHLEPSSNVVKYTNNSIGIYSVATIHKTHLVTNELYHVQKNGKVVTRWSKMANGQSYWKNNFAKQSRLNKLTKIKGAKLIGNRLALISIGLTAYDVAETGQIKPSQVINTFLAGASFTGVGAIVAGIYFAADFGTYLFTGRGIGDRLDQEFGPIYDFKE